MKTSMKMLALVLCAVMVLCMGVCVSVNAADQDSQGKEIFHFDVDELFADVEIGTTVTDFKCVADAGFTMNTTYFKTTKKNGVVTACTIIDTVATAKIVSDGKGGKALEFTFPVKRSASRAFDFTYTFVEGNRYKFELIGKFVRGSGTGGYIRNAVLFDAYSTTATNNMNALNVELTKDNNKGIWGATISSQPADFKSVESYFTIGDITYSGTKDPSLTGLQIGSRSASKVIRVLETQGTFAADSTVTIDYAAAYEYEAADINFNIAEGVTAATRGDAIVDGDTIKAIYNKDTKFTVASDKDIVVKANGEEVAVVDGEVNLGVITTETTVDIELANTTPVAPAIEKTEVKFVDYEGKSTVYVYSLISKFTDESTPNFGITLWDVENEDAKLDLYAKDASQNNLVADAAGQAFVIKAYGTAISEEKSYGVQAFVGDVKGEAVTLTK